MTDMPNDIATTTS